MCIQNNMKYVEGANKTYPQWNDEYPDAKELMDKFKRFHEILRNEGYNIKAANVAEKDNKFFWILLADDKENLKLEQYGYIE